MFISTRPLSVMVNVASVSLIDFPLIVAHFFRASPHCFKPNIEHTMYTVYVFALQFPFACLTCFSMKLSQSERTMSQSSTLYHRHFVVSCRTLFVMYRNKFYPSEFAISLILFVF